MGTIVCCGKRQPKLLGDFESVGLGSFGVIRPEIHVHDRPAILVGDLGAKAIDVIVRPADADHCRPENQTAEDLPLLQIVRDHDKAANSRDGRVGRGAVGKVAGAGAADGVEAKFNGLGDGDGNDALLVRIGRVVARIILDPKFTAPELLAQALAPFAAA